MTLKECEEEDDVKYVSQIHKKIDMDYHHSVRLNHHKQLHRKGGYVPCLITL